MSRRCPHRLSARPGFTLVELLLALALAAGLTLWVWQAWPRQGDRATVRTVERLAEVVAATVADSATTAGGGARRRCRALGVGGWCLEEAGDDGQWQPVQQWALPPGWQASGLALSDSPAAPATPWPTTVEWSAAETTAAASFLWLEVRPADGPDTEAERWCFDRRTGARQPSAATGVRP